MVYLMRNIQVPEIGLGATGAAVFAMQAILEAKGYFCGVDGIFGPITKEELICFQLDNDLAADGICGKNSWIKLISG